MKTQKSLIVSASILSADFANLADQIGQLEKSSCDWVHIDVMDGQFAPNITMGPFIVSHCKRITQLPLDVHLMIVNPENLVPTFLEAGAKYLSVHIEGNPLIVRTLKLIREKGAHPGIALAPSTPPALLESVLPYIDFILIMTVDPGFSGQAFLPEMVEKIKKTKSMIDAGNYNVQIQVDGGINAKTLPAVYQAGANIAVAASAIFNHPDGIAAGVHSLKESI